VVQRDALRNHAAKRKSHDVRGRHRAGIQYVHDIPNEITEPQRVFGLPGSPMPAQVEAQNPEIQSQGSSD
jgi:hypothetical protein